MTLGNRKTSSYIGEDSHREIARLILQDRRFTQEAGSVVPETIWRRVQRVLDLGCGPGSWLLSIAERHPHLQELIGIDANPRILEIARTLARAENADNVHFLEADATCPLEFVDESFDFINGRLMHSFLAPDDWPRLLGECFRLLRPGGVLCLTEYEAAFANSQAAYVCFQHTYDALWRAKRSFSPQATSVGIACMLAPFLRSAGFQDIRLRGICLDASHGAEGFEDWREDLILMSHTFRPFLVEAGVATPEALDRALEDTLRAMAEPSFAALAFNVCAWGVKPMHQGG